MRCGSSAARRWKTRSTASMRAAAGRPSGSPDCACLVKRLVVRLQHDRLRAQPGHAAPRHQAEEHHAGQVRRDAGRRLGPGPAVRPQRDDARRSGEETLTPSSGDERVGDAHRRPVGTPAYMSPEQAEDDWEKVGPASDVYSLGDDPVRGPDRPSPASGRHIGEVLEHVRRGELHPAATGQSRVPRPLDAICRKAMALKFEDRYPTALDLADDLDRWIADEPVTAYREPWPSGSPVGAAGTGRPSARSPPSSSRQRSARPDRHHQQPSEAGDPAALRAGGGQFPPRP